MIILLMTIAAATSELSVGNVSLDQGLMHLAGPIVWEHPIGSLRAQEAEAVLLDKGWSLPHEIILRRDVEIRLPDKSILKADFAALNAKDGIAILHGTSSQKVRYEKPADKLKLESLKLEFQTDGPYTFKSSKIKQIIAEGEVVVDVDSKGEISGDRMILSELSPEGRFKKVEMISNEGRCTLKTSNQEEVETSSIHWDMDRDHVELQSPKGMVKNGDQQLFFSAASMSFENHFDKISLAPPVKLWGEVRLESQGTFTINRGANKSLNCEGPSTLTFIDSKTLREHRVTTTGTIKVDHDKSEAVIEKGDDQQIHFEDPLGEIWADHAVFTYQQDGDQVKPLILLLEGNVKIQNLSGASTQYALADTASLDFDQRTIELKATKRPRVLFYDPLNKVQASAPGLIIKRDATTNKDTLKGIGDMRFEFAEDELKEFKERFMLHGKSK